MHRRSSNPEVPCLQQYRTVSEQTACQCCWKSGSGHTHIQAFCMLLPCSYQRYEVQWLLLPSVQTYHSHNRPEHLTSCWIPLIPPVFRAAYWMCRWFSQVLHPWKLQFCLLKWCNPLLPVRLLWFQRCWSWIQRASSRYCVLLNNHLLWIWHRELHRRLNNCGINYFPFSAPSFLTQILKETAPNRTGLMPQALLQLFLSTVSYTILLWLKLMILHLIHYNAWTLISQYVKERLTQSAQFCSNYFSTNLCRTNKVGH